MEKRNIISIVSLLLVTLAALSAAEFHVATHGMDSNPGTASAPWRSIQHAADLARPGDTITVHEGTYREQVNPPRGGESEAKRIIYQAVPGGKVEIKGSEIVGNWSKLRDDVWKATLPASFFGAFNPYDDLIRGDWFVDKGRKHHTGAVYLNGNWLTEAASLEEVMRPASATPLWFGTVENGETTLWAQFKGMDPNRELVEINVRRAVFYPDQPGRNFITVRGFTMRHAATPWAPPTAEQIGLIGTHWSKGWIIEDNTISHSTCVGITLGKYGDAFDNTSANSAEGYVKTIERAHAFRIPWTRDAIGHHIVRNNRVSHCEQAGIVGSLGCSFSKVTGNVVRDIHVRRQFCGAEQAGIKFHGAIDAEISGNRIHHTHRGIWLDWMSQGTRVSRNLFHDNQTEDLFVEVNHGPFVVDNNIFLSRNSLRDVSQGGAYLHNLFAGKIESAAELSRDTPYHPAHSTVVSGLANIKGGDNRFFNNLFIGDGGPPAAPLKMEDGHRPAAGFGLWMYDSRGFPLVTGGNVYCRGARPSGRESGAVMLADLDPRPDLVDGFLHLALAPSLLQVDTTSATTENLGKAAIPGIDYLNPDGSPLVIDTDYLGRKRNGSNPTPGPFEQPATGKQKIEICKNDIQP